MQYDEAQLQAAVLKRTSVLCKRTKIGSRYRNFVAAKDWWEGVKHRYPELKIRLAQELG